MWTGIWNLAAFRSHHCLSIARSLTLSLGHGWKKGFSEIHYIEKNSIASGWPPKTNVASLSKHSIRKESNGFDFVCFWQITKKKNLKDDSFHSTNNLFRYPHRIMTKMLDPNTDYTVWNHNFFFGFTQRCWTYLPVLYIRNDQKWDAIPKTIRPSLPNRKLCVKKFCCFELPIRNRYVWDIVMKM